LRTIALAACALVLVSACGGPRERDAGTRRALRPPAPEPAPLPQQIEPFDFRLAEWMPNVYVGSTRTCRLVGLAEQRRRTLALCTTGTWGRGTLAWDHTTEIELGLSDADLEVLDRNRPRVGCSRDVRVRVLESRRRMVRAVLVDPGPEPSCRGPMACGVCPGDPRFDLVDQPAASDLHAISEDAIAVCWITELHAVEREGDELVATLSCRHGERISRATVYAALSRADDIARLAPARIAELRVDLAERGAVEGELVSVQDGPWFDPRSREAPPLGGSLLPEL
jgi:hypothetical protein